MLTVMETVCISYFGGGTLDWDYLDTLMDNVEEVGYKLDSFYDFISDDYQIERIDFNSIMDALYMSMIGEFIDTLKYYTAEIHHDFLEEVENELYNSIYTNYIDSGIDHEFEEYVENFDYHGFLQKELLMNRIYRPETIAWLETTRNSGAFEGYPEQDMDFEELDDEEIYWYWANWVEPTKEENY